MILRKAIKRGVRPPALTIWVLLLIRKNKISIWSSAYVHLTYDVILALAKEIQLGLEHNVHASRICDDHRKKVLLDKGSWRYLIIVHICMHDN